MANITSLGVGSGLDLESIVQAYIDAEAIPQEIRLQEKEERLNLELSGVGSFKSAMSTFNDTLEKLTEVDAFSKQVISSSSTAIDVTSNGFASNGTFNIDVTQLATGTRLNSQTFLSSSDTVGTGTLTFANGTDTFDVLIDPADSLSVIRDKINAESGNFGVTANIINGELGSFLVFDSQVTGASNALTISTSDASLDAISTNNISARVAQDANISIDGTAITSSTNEFKNVIEDVTINVKEITSSSAVLSIAQDTEGGEALIDEFIAGYNELFQNLTGLGAAKEGRLAFDPNVRQVKQQMADIAIQAVNGLSGSVNGLFDIGLEINKDGLLQKSTFSSANIPSGQQRLDNALADNLTEVGELFASTDGIATKLASMIDGYIASEGVLTQRENTLNERVRDIPNEWEDLEERLRSYEAILRKQFNFLDSTVAQYNATASWITSALALPSSSDN